MQPLFETGSKILGSSGFLVGDFYWLMSSNTLPYHGMDLSAGVKKLYRLGYYENQTDLYRAVQFSRISCPGPIEGNFW